MAHEEMYSKGEAPMNEAAAAFLTVVVPVFNVKTHVAATMRSLARQTRSDFEVIIVDDGSTDGSLEIIKAELRRVKDESWHLLSQANAGVSAARNLGLAAARGEYILFLDGDDQVHSSLVELLADAAVNKPDIIGWGFAETTLEKAETNSRTELQRPLRKVTLRGPAAVTKFAGGALSVWTGSLAYRRKFLLLHHLGHTEGCSCGQDREFQYKALARARATELIDATLSYWVMRGDSRMRTYDVRRFEAIAALERAFDDLSSLSDPDLDRVATKFRRSTVQGHFFFNVNSCIAADIPRSVSLFDEIDTAFPGMLARMRGLVGESSPISRRIFVRSTGAYRLWIILRVTAYKILRRPVRCLRRALSRISARAQ